MHLPDAPDTAGNKHVAGPPKSIIGRHLLNALAYEIANAIVDDGLTLNPDGATDEANTAWKQLSRLIRKVAGHDQNYVGFANVGQNGFGVGTSIIRTVNADPFLATGLYHVTQLAESGGPFSGGLVQLEEDPKYLHRMIIVFNGTGSSKLIQSQSGGATHTLANGFSGIFHDFNGFWRPVKIS